MKKSTKPEVKMLPVTSLKPYEKNPRYNAPAVSAVAASIRAFGWKVPIVVDRNGVVITGHTRLMAAEELGIEEVPVIVADWLTDDQAKAFRLADNKTAELSSWKMSDLDRQLLELGAFDMDAFGFHTVEAEEPEREEGAGSVSLEKEDAHAGMVRCPHCGLWVKREEARREDR